MTRSLPVALAVIGLVGVRPAAAQRDTVSIPADTVVRVKLDDPLSSRTTREGDTFAAIADNDDTSGFPEGTRFQGVVTEVRRKTSNQPGVLDFEFRRAYLPDGRRVDIDGQLASLEYDDIRRTDDGRIEARSRRGSDKFDLKWVGYGAAAGAVLSTIFGGNLLKGGLLGGLGGAVYGYLNRDKGGSSRDFKDVSLERGKEFGIRMLDRVAFDYQGGSRYGYNGTYRNSDYRNGTYRDGSYGTDRDYRYSDDRYSDDTRYRDDRVLGDRGEYRTSSAVVRVNGREVRFGQARPVTVNGTLYVPLAAIADAANWRFTHRAGERDFVLYTDDRTIRGTTSTSSASPMLISREVYVPASYLSRSVGMRTGWNRSSETLDLDF
jgi:hypothetical protein